jgi:HJR/Mrr/RecB family endonuclease
MNIIFIGGAGGNAFIRHNINPKNTYNVINTDSGALAMIQEQKGQIPNVKYSQIFTEKFHGLGTGGQYELVYKHAIENRNILESILNGNDMNVIISGLGGGTGTGITLAISDILVDKKFSICFIVLKPFDFEGYAKQNIANTTIEQIKKSGSNYIVIENQKLLKVIDKRTTIKNAFKLVDDSIYMIIESMSSYLDSNIEIFDKKRIESITDGNVTSFFEEAYRQLTELNEKLDANKKIFVVDRSREIIQELKVSPDLVYSINPFVFEDVIYKIYELLGFRAEKTKSSHDKGADILVRTSAPLIGPDFLTIIQAKKYTYNHKVGSPEIRDLYGAKFLYNAHRAQCVTTYGFSKEAMETSKQMTIDLFLFNDLLAKLK